MNRCRRVFTLVAAVMLVAPPLASAQSLYAAVRGGPGVTSDTRQGPTGREDTYEYATGFTGGAAVGYRLPFDLRVEGEVGYMHTPVSRDGGVPIDGAVKTWLFMANAYYDLGLGVLGPFKPYVGFGLGGARVNEDHEIFINRLHVNASSSTVQGQRINYSGMNNHALELGVAMKF